MLKYFLAFLSVITVFLSPTVANAQHLSSPWSNIIELDGEFAIGSIACSLKLRIRLTEKGSDPPPLYDSSDLMIGTMQPLPSPACSSIFIVTGDHDVFSFNPISNSGTIIINNLEIGSSSTCHTGPIYADVYNISPIAVRMDIPVTTTVCGSIEATLYSVPLDGIQITN